VCAPGDDKTDGADYLRYRINPLSVAPITTRNAKRRPSQPPMQAFRPFN